MRVSRALWIGLAGACVASSPGLSAQDAPAVEVVKIADAADKKDVRFAPPKRIRAGDAFLGAGRLYPSPAIFDVDGDGRRDLVIGDLFGKVTWAACVGEGKKRSFAAEKAMKNRSGQPLKFHNW